MNILSDKKELVIEIERRLLRKRKKNGNKKWKTKKEAGNEMWKGGSYWRRWMKYDIRKLIKKREKIGLKKQ